MKFINPIRVWTSGKRRSFVRCIQGKVMAVVPPWFAVMSNRSAHWEQHKTVRYETDQGNDYTLWPAKRSCRLGGILQFWWWLNLPSAAYL